MNDDIFVVIGWPDCQEYMEKSGWNENSALVNTDSLYEEYGDSAYFVRKSWLDDIKKKVDHQ